MLAFTQTYQPDEADGQDDDEVGRCHPEDLELAVDDAEQTDLERECPHEEMDQNHQVHNK